MPAGEKFVSLLVFNFRGAGGFRESSQNYVGNEAITDARSAFRESGFLLGADGVPSTGCAGFPDWEATNDGVVVLRGAR